MLFNKYKNRIAELQSEINSLRQKLHDAEMVIANQKLELNDQNSQRKAGENEEIRQNINPQKLHLNTVNVNRSARAADTVRPQKYTYKSEITRKAIKLISEKSREEIRKNLGSLKKTSSGVSFSSFDPQIKSLIHNFSYARSENGERYIIVDGEKVDIAVLSEDANARKRFYEVEVAAIRRSDELRKQREDRKNNRKEWEDFLHLLNAALDKNAAVILRRFRDAYVKDEYGNLVKDTRNTEIESFLAGAKLITKSKRHDMEKIRQYIKRWHAKKMRAFEKSSTAPDNGHDFEHWVAAKLNEAGWTARVTQASGDDGVDVIAERDSLSVAVQCKRFKGSVGNKAVQEVYSGMKHMQLHKAVVISTGKYTKAAQNLAATTGVLLLSEQDIQHMWEILNK